MDDDLAAMPRDALIEEVKRLRAGIREHRDSSGHDLCWHHPNLWGLLPEPIPTDIAVPPLAKIFARLPQISRSPRPRAAERTGAGPRV